MGRPARGAMSIPIRRPLKRWSRERRERGDRPHASWLPLGRTQTACQFVNLTSAASREPSCTGSLQSVPAVLNHRDGMNEILAGDGDYPSALRARVLVNSDSNFTAAE